VQVLAQSQQLHQVQLVFYPLAQLLLLQHLHNIDQQLASKLVLTLGM
jgi:hypothetical protein